MAREKIVAHPIPSDAVEVMCSLGREMSKMQGETPELRKVVTRLADSVEKLIQVVYENTQAVKEHAAVTKKHEEVVACHEKTVKEEMTSRKPG